jgi:hypothetical protein
MKARALIRLTMLIMIILLLAFCLILISENYLISDVLKALIYLLIIGLSFFFGWLIISFFSFPVRKAPGTRLLSLAKFLYSPESVEQVFHPLVADLRQEYFDELKKGNTLKARWLVFRYHYAFTVAAIYSMGRIKKSNSTRKEKVPIKARD